MVHEYSHNYYKGGNMNIDMNIIKNGTWYMNIQMNMIKDRTLLFTPTATFLRTGKGKFYCGGRWPSPYKDGE